MSSEQTLEIALFFAFEPPRMAVFRGARRNNCAYDACGTVAEAWRAARYTSYKAQCMRRCTPSL